MKQKFISACLLCVLLLSSCTVYKSGMEIAEYNPLPNKLPVLEYDYSSVKLPTGMPHPDILKQAAKSELEKNMMQQTGLPVGTLLVKCEKLDVKGNKFLPALSGITFFALNILGMPMGEGEIDMEMSFIIKSLNGTVVKKYSYAQFGRVTFGLYYGEDYEVKILSLCRKILDEFRHDVTRDYDLICSALVSDSKPDDMPGYLLAEEIQPAGKSVERVSVVAPQPEHKELDRPVEPVAEVRNKPSKAVKSDVDIHIPVTGRISDDTFVLIIANENYMFVDNAEFALNDGEVFREYCIKTLGIPERQVWMYRDATAGVIFGGVDKMVQAMNIFDNAKAIVYYCGHGIPDEKTGDAYIIPTDGNGTNMATCYSLNRLYKQLAESKARSVTYFIDACFSGANKDGSMLVAARGVARKVKKETIEGNTVVFSAASGDETAMAYKAKSHGLFTYFLLKKLQETQGNVTYGDLADYIRTNVRKEAFLTNEKLQTPVVATSIQAENLWKTMSFK